MLARLLLSPATMRAQVGSVPHTGWLVFVTGAVVMAAEMAASRLVAPYFGSSTPVWATLITLVMLALALGAELGGRAADRWPSPEVLGAALVGCALWLTATPFVARPLLADAAHALRAHALVHLAGAIGLLALVAVVPLALMGAVSPFAARLASPRARTPWDDGRGGTFGRVSALGTAGSVTGTLLAVFVVMPALGTTRTIIVFALVLALTAALAARFLPGAVAAAPIALALFFAPAVSPTLANATIARESPYALVQVSESPDGTKRLAFDEGFATQSVQRPGRLSQGEVFDHYLLAPWLTGQVSKRPNVLLLGLGAGTSARGLRALLPEATIVGVELDPVVAELARTEFGLPSDVEVHVADARAHLESEARRFDVIIVDAFRFPYVPFHLVTEELAVAARAHLAPGGVLVMNLGRWQDERAIVDRGAATLLRVFPSVWLADAHTPSNTLVYAGEGDLAARLTARTSDVPAELRPFAHRVARELRRAETDAAPFTDDHAPVEALTDAIVLGSLASLWR